MSAKHPCPCCNQNTLEEVDFYNICPVCGWEDDPGQRAHPDDNIGANDMSLNDARASYRKGLQVKSLEDQKIDCPLLQREIPEGLCLEIILAVDRELKRDAVPEVTDWEKANTICPGCQEYFKK